MGNREAKTKAAGQVQSGVSSGLPTAIVLLVACLFSPKTSPPSWGVLGETLLSL